MIEDSTLIINSNETHDASFNLHDAITVYKQMRNLSDCDNFVKNHEIWVAGPNQLRHMLEPPRKDGMELRSPQGIAIGEYILSCSFKKPSEGYAVEINDISAFCHSMLKDLKNPKNIHSVSWIQGHVLYLMSVKSFDTLIPPKQLNTPPYLIKNEENEYGLFGVKYNKWVLTPIANLDVPTEWIWPNDWTKQEKTYIRPGTEIFNKLKANHFPWIKSLDINALKFDARTPEVKFVLDHIRYNGVRYTDKKLLCNPLSMDGAILNYCKDLEFEHEEECRVYLNGFFNQNDFDISGLVGYLKLSCPSTKQYCRVIKAVD